MTANGTGMVSLRGNVSRCRALPLYPTGIAGNPAAAVRRRMVLFDLKMARSFYRLPERDIKAAAQKLETEGIFTRFEGGFLLQADAELLQRQDFDPPVSVFVLHRNDILVKANEHWLKEAYGDGENDILQYILWMGEFQGAVLGPFQKRSL